MMTKKNKVLTTVGSVLGVAFITLGTLYFVWDYKPKSKHVVDEWNYTDTYTDKYVATLNKDPNKDFTILNLADIQVSDFEGIGENKNMKNLIKELINKTNPSLITLTGDQIWTNHSKNALKREIKWFSSFGIPWAPVFGNHDLEGTATPDWACKKLERAKNCLFKRGPSNLGSLGNYVVNVKEGNKIVKSCYMMNLGSVDEFSSGQVNFVKWHAENNKNESEFPEGITFMHQAIDVYNDAYYYHKNDAIGDVYRSFYIADPGSGAEYLKMAKTINMTDFVCGHQHGNCWTIPVDGIRYTFALKTGDNCSTYESVEGTDDFIVGGTSIKLSGGETIVTHNFVGKEFQTEK